jgi:hypothetical protein
MDQQHPGTPDAGPDESPYAGPDVTTVENTGERTGMAEVDAVLASLDGLADRPVAEHVAVFEHAHDRLRRALDAPSD